MAYREPTQKQIAAAWRIPNCGRSHDEVLRDRYENYVACASDLGWQIKTFEEWLQS